MEKLSVSLAKTLGANLTIYTIDAALVPCELLWDDKKFLINRLPITDKKLRYETAMNYRAKWIEGMEQEPNEFKKQDAGRYIANTWLREHFGEIERNAKKQYVYGKHKRGFRHDAISTRATCKPARLTQGNH